MFALYKNILEDDDVTLIASATYSSMPIENILDDKLVKYGRIGDGSQYIQATFGSAKSFDAMAIAGWGFSSVVFQASNAADFSTVLVNSTLSDVYVNPDTSCGYAFAWLQAAVTAKYVRVVFSGDNKKNVGKIMLGTMKQFPWMESKQKLAKVTTAKSTRSAGGQLYPGNVGYNARQVEVTFPEYADAGFALIDDLWQTVKNKRPFFSVVWDDKQNVSPLLYGALNQDSIEQTATGIPSLPFSSKLNIMECF